MDLSISKIVVLTAWISLVASTQAIVVTWDNDVANDFFWSSAENWAGDTAPVSGIDSIVLNGDLGGSNKGAAVLDADFTVASGQSITTTASPADAIDMRFETGGGLTLATGGTVDLGIVLARNDSASMTFVIEPSATLNLYRYLIDAQITTEFIADANGVTAMTIANNLDLESKNVGGATLKVDLTHYDLAQGTTLVLMDYGSLVNGDDFGRVTLTVGWTADVDYAYDIDGNGDLGVALINMDWGALVPPVATNQFIVTPGLSLEFDETARPVSMTNAWGEELLFAAASDGFYLEEANGSIRRFDTIENLSDNELRFSISGSPEKLSVQFDGAHDYMTVKFTSLTNFALVGEKLFFNLETIGEGVQALSLDYMIADNRNIRNGVSVERRSLWETSTNNPLGSFALYQYIGEEQEDDTLIDLWVDEGLPHPAVTGVWDRAAANTWVDIWINANYDVSYINANPANLAEHEEFLSYAAMMDAKSIYLNNRIWKGIEVDGIDSGMYPNGEADVAAFAAACARNGQTLTFHRMSGSLEEEDPDYCSGNVTVDPGVEHWGTMTLNSMISSAETSISVTPDVGVEMPVYYTGLGRPIYPPPVVQVNFDFDVFRIGNEWVKAGSFIDLGNGTWRLENLARGQYNTTAQSYSGGTEITGYFRGNGNVFQPSANSVLVQDVAARWGSLNNRLSLGNASFDGAAWHMARGFWGFEKFAAMVYETLDHPTWSITSHGLPPEAWIEYQFNRVKNAFGGSFKIGTQASFYVGDESRITPSLEELEYEMFQTLIENNRGFSIGRGGTLGVDLASFHQYGLTEQWLIRLKDYKRASLALDETLRGSMDTLHAISKKPLISLNMAPSFWRIEGSVFRRWYSMGTDVYNNEWYYGQEHGNVTPRFYVQNGKEQPLMVPADLASGYDQVRVIGRVLPRFAATSINNVDLMAEMGVGSSRVCSGINTTSTAVFDENRLTSYPIMETDLSGNKGIGLTVTGDGSGATLIIRLNTSGLARDYAVPINFTGRRWIEIPTGEQGWRLWNWSWCPSTKKVISYNKINGISIGLGYLPANTSARVTVEDLQALEELSDPMVSPTITVGDQTVNVTGTLNTGNHFILDPGGKFTVYDEDWNTLSVESLNVFHPSNLATFKMESASSSSNIWLEVGVQAVAGTQVNPLYTTSGTLKSWLDAHGLSSDLADDDADGLLSWEEYVAGTNPTNSASVLRLFHVAPQVFEWQAISGKTYAVWFKTNLADAVWTDLGAASGSYTSQTDTATGFYRVDVAP